MARLSAFRRGYGSGTARIPPRRTQVLTQPAMTKQAIARQAEVYRQALSLILAEQRPAYYLIQNRAGIGDADR